MIEDPREFSPLVQFMNYGGTFTWDEHLPHGAKKYYLRMEDPFTHENTVYGPMDPNSAQNVVVDLAVDAALSIVDERRMAWLSQGAEYNDEPAPKDPNWFTELKRTVSEGV